MLQCNRRPNAKAIVSGSEKYPHIHGEVLFYQQKGAVLVQARIFNLPQNKSGFFGFHIHEGADCGGTDFQNTGSHLNPGNLPHPSHMGDMPPLMYADKNAFMTFKTDRFSIGQIIGRTIVIHYDADDFITQPSGNAGEKIACGVIRAE